MGKKRIHMGLILMALSAVVVIWGTPAGAIDFAISGQLNRDNIK